jgi:hypothetical protein
VDLSPDALTQTILQAGAASASRIPVEPISNIETACASSVDPAEAVITFLLERTGETGELRFSQSSDEQSAMSYSVGGNLMLSYRGRQADMFGAETKSSPILAQRLVTIQNDSVLPALASLLSRPSVIQRIHECLKRVFANNSCSDQCEKIRDVAGGILVGTGSVGCGVIGIGIKALIGAATPVPGGAAAGAVIGLVGCAFTAISVWDQNNKPKSGS